MALAMTFWWWAEKRSLESRVILRNLKAFVVVIDCVVEGKRLGLGHKRMRSGGYGQEGNKES